MNCILFGLGPHAERIYLRYLSELSNINKLFIVDLKERKVIIEEYLKKYNLNYELILFENAIRNKKKIEKKNYEALKKVVLENKIEKAIISTEPRSHKMYIDFCLDFGIDILCDKPITTPLYTNTQVGTQLIKDEYEEIVDKYKKSSTTIFELQTQRRAHCGYSKVREIVEGVVRDYGVPINKISISHCDGNWNMPDETISRENHPYKYGYGKLMHSGYHFIDLLSSFIEINERHGFKSSSKLLRTSDYRPNDFYKYFGKDFHEKINFKPNDDYFDNLEVVRNFGEIDISTIIEYKDSDEDIITTAYLELVQSGFSKRSWDYLPTDTYKGNGRVRHETLNLSVGPLLNIKVLSYQANEVRNDDVHKSDIGDLDHFDVLVFRNSEIIGGKTFEKIEINENQRHSYIGHNEEARFKILSSFFTGENSYSNILAHKVS